MTGLLDYLMQQQQQAPMPQMQSQPGMNQQAQEIEDYARKHGPTLLGLLHQMTRGPNEPDQLIPSDQRPNLSLRDILMGGYQGSTPPPIQRPQNYMHNPFFTQQYGWQSGPRNPAIGS